MHAPTPHKRVELSCQPGVHGRAPGFLVSPRRCPSPAEPPHTRRCRDPRIADKALVGPVYNDHLFFATWGLGLLCVIMSWARRYLFVSNADNGQTAPLMPIMLELAQRGCQCILVSAAKVPRLRKKMWSLYTGPTSALSAIRGSRHRRVCGGPVGQQGHRRSETRKPGARSCTPGWHDISTRLRSVGACMRASRS